MNRFAIEMTLSQTRVLHKILKQKQLEETGDSLREIESILLKIDLAAKDELKKSKGLTK